ncbi:MAG: 50S ribosomal protein L18 [Nanoarchaeota archaeon]
MAKDKKYNVKLKRKRLGLTDYGRRLKLLKSKDYRLVIRKSLSNLVAQIIKFDVNGDEVIVSAHTKELARDFGWKANRGNIPSAYLTGFLLGLKAKEKKINKVIADFGLQDKGLRLYAALRGVIDAGLDAPHSKDILPRDDFIKGVFISNYAKIIGSHSNAFSNYIKNNLQLQELPKHFEDVKKLIMEKYHGKKK